MDLSSCLTDVESLLTSVTEIPSQCERKEVLKTVTLITVIHEQIYIRTEKKKTERFRMTGMTEKERERNKEREREWRVRQRTLLKILLAINKRQSICYKNADDVFF